MSKLNKQRLDLATVRELVDLKGKRVFLRADLNVPIFDGKIGDETRIQASLKTLQYLLDKGAKVIMASHLGRPKGKEEKHSLLPVYDRLMELLPDTNIAFAPDCIGKATEAMVEDLKNGELLLLENLRFYKEETANDEAFAKKLSAFADYYVNDAFGAAHRAHASTQGITRFIPAVMGFLMEKELKILGEALQSPKRPFTVILGGKKVSDKMGVINNLLDIANTILVGGGMAFTFAVADGGSVGNSIVDEESIEYCKEVQKIAKQKGVKLIIATDCIAADEFSPAAHTQVVDNHDIPDGWEGLDIGPATIELFKKHIKGSGTVMWNGPMGVSEFEKFAKGTTEIADAVIESKAVSIIGGGDTASAVVRFGIADKFTYISTGGGASLEFIEGKTLPGVESLLGKEARIK